MKPTKLHLLGELCRRGARGAPVRATTIELAGAVGASQQTVSRWLNELSAEGFVSKSGKRVRLLRQACAEIEGLADALAKARENAPKTTNNKIVFRGVVVKGLGEGAKFLSLPGYAKQLREALGWKPFPGTLNLKLDAESSKSKLRLESMGGLAIRSFLEGNKRFGSVKLFSCVVKANRREERGAVILPEKSFYGESILEVVAPSDLRRKLGLKDAFPVVVKLLVLE